MDNNYKACALIPVYNHGSTAGAVVAALIKKGLPVVMVDDGSDGTTKEQLAEIEKSFDDCYLFTLPQNEGKGGAMIRAFKEAHKLGFTHGLQIDADGQHDLEPVDFFINESKTNPEKIIAGRPVYDESVPKARLYGRKITNFWAAIETLSMDIKDGMCGFRMYPLQPTVDLLNKTRIRKRMEFDTEVLVRLHWRGVRMAFHPVKVIYPEGGISHFDVLKDNLKISWMHTILFFGMLLRFPVLIFRKFFPKRK